MLKKQKKTNTINYLENIYNNHIFSNDLAKAICKYLIDHYRLNPTGFKKRPIVFTNNLFTKNPSDNFHQEHVYASYLKYYFKARSLTSNVFDQLGSNIFHSSGTISKLAKRFVGDENNYMISNTPSSSVFSQDGCFIYRIVSLTGFFSCLNRCPYPIETMKGISLIPNTKHLKSSSLSQMIQWFSEYFEISYVDSFQHLQELIAYYKGQNHGVWIFATSGNFLDNNIDTLDILNYDRISQLSSSQLHQNVFLFETGGTKDLCQKTSYNNVSALDIKRIIYKIIHHELRIPFSNIGSEYSSCELSSQAWAFFDRDFYNHRSYLAPYYFLNPFVSIDSNKINNTPIGELVIKDFSRIDLNYPYNTEDLATLTKNDGFWLEKRRLYRFNRGCSWKAGFSINIENKSENFRNLLKSSNLSLDDCSFFQQTKNSINENRIVDNTFNYCVEDGKDIGSFLAKLFHQELFHSFLLAEFCDTQIVESCVSDLIQSTNHTSDEWIRACKNSMVDKISKDHRVLVIPPKNHSLSCLHPLTLLILANKQIVIRNPKINYDYLKIKKIQTNYRSLIELYVNKLCQFIGVQNNIQFVGSEYDLTVNNPFKSIQYQHLFIQGSNSTVCNLLDKLSKKDNANKTKIKISGYGSSIAINIIQNLTQQKLDLAFKDFYSLAQRGCMSSVMLVVDYRQFEYTKRLLTEYSSVKLILSLEDSLAVIRRIRDISLYKGSWFKNRYSEVYFPYYIINDCFQLHRVSYYIEQCCFLWPIVFYQTLAQVQTIIRTLHHLKYIATDYDPQDLIVDQNSSILFKPLGKLNHDRWNGFFENKPMFSILN